MDNGGRRAGTHLITRGNVDGIVSAAIFLHHCPRSRVTFVNSPNSAARALSSLGGGDEVFVVDISPNEALSSSIERFTGIVEIIDHHDRSGIRAASAAHLLHSRFGSEPNLQAAVLMADLLEGRIIDSEGRSSGRCWDEMRHEAEVLDFAWRLDISDDQFREQAALSLSTGLLPTEIPLIMDRYEKVRRDGRWERALERASRSARKAGKVAVLDFSKRKKSLYGFGSRACAQIATEMGCSYSLLIHGDGSSASLSVRRHCPSGIDLGAFMEDFARSHEADGGGHPMSAGGRIHIHSVERFVEELANIA